ncbi:MAG: hypothetical protein RI925_1569 [Pseudomonadota bacterium]
MGLFPADAGLRIAMVAGEASGDMLGARLIDAIRARRPDARFVGIGGPKMQAAGLESLYPQETLAVRGYVEVLRSLRSILAIRRELKAKLLAERPDVFIGVDAPDFNLHVEQVLKSAGIRTIHYVSPSIWAWRGERVFKIKQAVNRVLALFPMEAPIYQAAGVPVSYVGHPLAESMPLQPDREAARELLHILPRQATVFTLMPGSRQGEVDVMAPLFIATAREILRHEPDAQFLVPLATRATFDRFEQLLWRLKAHQLPIRRLFGHAQHAMVAADAVLVASGTATLEVALAKRPMVISYKISPITYRIVKRKLKLPYVGLPNILCGEFIVPELLQDDATPANLAQALLNAWRDPDYRAWLDDKLTELHLTLKQDSAARAAQAVLEVVGENA